MTHYFYSLALCATALFLSGCRSKKITAPLRQLSAPQTRAVANTKDKAVDSTKKQLSPKKLSGKERDAITRSLRKNKLAKQANQLTFDEARRAKEHYVALGRYDLASKALERMLSLSSDHAMLASLMLELADLYVVDSEFDKAVPLYEQFCLLYPADARRKYAHYQLILTTFWNILDAHHDQVATEKAIGLCEHFLSDFPQDEEYAAAVKQTLTTCYATLLDRELTTARFYLTRHNIKGITGALHAAEQRLIYAKDQILTALSSYHPACAAAINSGNMEQQEELSIPQRAEKAEQEIERLTTLLQAVYKTTTEEA
jgi:outer membrane assembly lipoprotein YfiO